MKRVGRYFKRVWLSLNQFIGSLAGGSPDETISARAGRTGNCGLLDMPDPGHCERAVENERWGHTQHPDYRPETFITRRGAILLVGSALLVARSGYAQESRVVVDLNKDFEVHRGDKRLTIDADAVWHALEAAARIPLRKE
jgi:hypothetical protein